MEHRETPREPLTQSLTSFLLLEGSTLQFLAPLPLSTQLSGASTASKLRMSNTLLETIRITQTGALITISKTHRSKRLSPWLMCLMRVTPLLYFRLKMNKRRLTLICTQKLPKRKRKGKNSWSLTSRRT